MMIKKFLPIWCGDKLDNLTQRDVINKLNEVIDEVNLHRTMAQMMSSNPPFKDFAKGTAEATVGSAIVAALLESAPPGFTITDCAPVIQAIKKYVVDDPGTGWAIRQLIWERDHE
jgi:hypothetical protein